MHTLRFVCSRVNYFSTEYFYNSGYYFFSHLFRWCVFYILILWWDLCSGGFSWEAFFHILVVLFLFWQFIMMNCMVVILINAIEMEWKKNIDQSSFSIIVVIRYEMKIEFLLQIKIKKDLLSSLCTDESIRYFEW